MKSTKIDENIGVSPFMGYFLCLKCVVKDINYGWYQLKFFIRFTHFILFFQTYSVCFQAFKPHGFVPPTPPSKEHFRNQSSGFGRGGTMCSRGPTDPNNGLSGPSHGPASSNSGPSGPYPRIASGPYGQQNSFQSNHHSTNDNKGNGPRSNPTNMSNHESDFKRLSRFDNLQHPPSSRGGPPPPRTEPYPPPHPPSPQFQPRAGRVEFNKETTAVCGLGVKREQSFSQTLR